ncbi:hypothetical protein EVA_13135 [gut metagenome]|uniref:Uncharacterized protein n=1 Tax=gut metagenome TaxID=749906 RepID=J9GAH2_9ZZZZ
MYLSLFHILYRIKNYNCAFIYILCKFSTTMRIDQEF